MRNNKGYTLIELMIALGVFALLMGYVYTTFFTQLRVFNTINGSSNMQYESRSVVRGISDILRNNIDISVDDVNGTWVKSGTTLVMYYDSRSKALKDGSGKVISSGIKYMYFRLQNPSYLEADVGLQFQSREFTIGFNIE